MQRTEKIRYATTEKVLITKFSQCFRQIRPHLTLSKRLYKHFVSNQYKGIEYVQLIPILIKAVQEQQVEIAVLKAKLDRDGY